MQERNCVLNEPAVNLVSQVVWQKVEDGDALNKIARTDAGPEPPEEILPARQGQMVKDIDVDGVTCLCVCRLEMRRAVEVSLDLDVRPVALHPLPASQQIPAVPRVFPSTVIWEGGEYRE